MPTIAEIEDAIAKRLKDKGLAVLEVDIRKGAVGLVKPAVYISTEEGRFEKVTQSTFKQRLSVYVYVIFRHLHNEKERRRGVYPIVESVIGILLLQDLGLKIQALAPLSFRNVTDEELNAAGLMAYQLVFETSCCVERTNDEALTDLLKVGLEYYLKPGDDVTDATDTVNVGV
ncbi:MAG: DUF1834 family protein [Deltaproteobacteria bacterium]|nr:DUF1834 family protein [Deltaproteobacteria bacterium]